MRASLAPQRAFVSWHAGDVMRVIDQRYLPIARVTLRRRGIADEVAN